MFRTPHRNVDRSPASSHWLPRRSSTFHGSRRFPQLEYLEDRIAPAIQTYIQGTILYAVGDNTNNDFTLSHRLDRQLGIIVADLCGTSYDEEDFSAIEIDTGNGSDSVNIGNQREPLTIDEQGAGNDEVTLPANGQTWGYDTWVSGNAGKDTVTIPVSGTVSVDDASVIRFRNTMHYSGNQQMTLQGQNVTSNTYNIEQTKAGSLITINEGGTGSDVVNVTPTTEDLTSIQGAIIVNGYNRADLNHENQLCIDDQKDSRSAAYTITDSTVQLNGRGLILYERMHGALTVKCGPHGNHVLVPSAADEGSNTTINAGHGGDTIDVGPLETLFGSWFIEGNGGSPTVNVNDQTGGAAQSLEISEREVITPQGGNLYTGIDYSGIGALTVNGGNSGSRIEVDGTAAGTTTTVNAGSGGGEIDVSYPGTIRGPLNIYGHGGAPALNVEALSDTSQSLTITSAAVRWSAPPGFLGVALTYYDLRSLVVDTRGSPSTVKVESTAPGTATNVIGGVTSHTLVGSDLAANYWDILAPNSGTLTGPAFPTAVIFSGFQNLSGGPTSDNFVIEAGGVDGTIQGGSGTSTLDYSNYPGNVIVDLPLHSASLVGGGVFGIQNVVGGSYGYPHTYNILVGDGGNLLVGGNGRRTLLIAGAAASTLYGGSDDDIVIGGTTAYDRDMDSLLAIMAEWTRTGEDFATRAYNLTHGIGAPLLDPTTVCGNGGGNTMIGNGELAFIFTDGLDTIMGFDPGSVLIPITDCPT